MKRDYVTGIRVINTATNEEVAAFIPGRDGVAGHSVTWNQQTGGNDVIVTYRYGDQFRYEPVDVPNSQI